MNGDFIRLNFSGKTILVVEDDTVSRMYLRELLAPTQALVEFVRTGNEALDYFKTNSSPHIILMDIKLPDIDGMTLSQILLEKDPTLNIIAQTAFANEEINQQCMAMGMKAYLTKPLRNDDLMKALAQLI